MSKFLHSTVTFEHVDGLPRDRVVNTFSFVSEVDLAEMDLDDISSAIEDFYNLEDATVDLAIGKHMSPAISRIALPVVRHYFMDGHLNGTPAGSPHRIDTWSANLAAASATALPAEVACVLSFHSEYNLSAEFAPGSRPRARKRGRLYIGPLNQSTLTTSSLRAVPAPAFTTRLADAGVRLRDRDDVAKWAVWSRTAGTMFPVTGLWVDDEFDTQRRRGERALTRTVRG